MSFRAVHCGHALVSPLALLTACAAPPDDVVDADLCPECECAECRDEKCTDLVVRCVAEGCACVLDCIGTQGLPGVDFCVDSCGLDEKPAGFADVEQCLAFGCPDADECFVGADYAPPDDTVLETTIEIGGGDLADCSFDAALPFDPFGAVVQLESADGAVCVRLERVDEGAGQLANTSFALTAAFIGPLGRVAHVENSGDLCFYSSHHNFADWAHVWTGTRRHAVKLEEFGHDGERAYSLFTFEQGPIDESTCGPAADGDVPVGETLKLFPVNP